MAVAVEEVALETVKLVEPPVAVVTGASRGIGKAVALALGGAGCKVGHMPTLYPHMLEIQLVTDFFCELSLHVVGAG